MDKQQDHRHSAWADARTRRKEEMKYYQEQMDKLLKNAAREQLSFPPTLDNVERKRLHHYARKVGLRTKSSGKGDDRFLTVFKKTATPFIPTRHSGAAVNLHLHLDTVQQIGTFLGNFPVTAAEQAMSIEKHSRSTQIAYVFGDGRARTVLKVPPVVVPHPAHAKARANLPIAEYREQILAAIQANQVVVVSGETGSGKTTQVPQYIMESCTADAKECRIICTQPRRLAATSIADRVSQERNDGLGQTVGYQIRLDSRVSPTSNLVFTTSGYLLRCLTGSSSGDVFKTITHLILDEVHEREKTTDFLLIAIRDAVKVNPHLKVILMSATIDSGLFSAYFDDCPVINVPGRLFEVKVHYLDDILYTMQYSSKKMREFMLENSMPKGLRDDASGGGPSRPQPQAAPNADAAHALPDDEKEFYDECLDECADGDDESTFDQICYLISDENMPSDYAHSNTGRTAMGIAAEKGFDSAVNKLLALGASPTHSDATGQTPIDYAGANGRDYCLEVLSAFVDSMPAQQAQVVVSPQETADGVAESNRRAVKHFTMIAYQLTNKKPAEIDHELLLGLVLWLHANTSLDGSILVFLPGYDDIMAQKELLENRARLQDIELFVLHSGVNGTNSSEQARVFNVMPAGVRKIVLATNIAETSITINDVVYVIDAGKVKQHTYDSVGGATCLRSVDISQACAKQRAGRAGRLRNGFCYRLYSAEQFDAMDAYTLPELLRVSLSEICLNARILAPDQMSIEAFLLKALQPPALNNIRTSIAFLKQIDALDAAERITQLGLHLANMPVDCQLGKAVLFGVLMRCLDPVLTIVSALSVKDPFLLPLGDEAEQIVQLKKTFAGNSLSDHRMLLNTFSRWSRLSARQTHDFCRQNFICHGNMQMIQGIKRLILGHLNGAGILPSTVDMKALNANSERWGVVKACLTAGIYPHICRINEFTGGIWSRQDAKLLPHLSSVLRDRKSKSQLDPDAMASGAEWMIHGEKSRIARYSLIRDISCIPSVVVAFFAGSMTLKCTFEQLDGHAALRADRDDGDDDDDDDLDDLDVDDLDDLDIDDGAEDDVVNGVLAMSLGADGNMDMDDGFETELKIDDWICFSMDNAEAQLLYGLRQKFMAVVMRFLQSPARFAATGEESQTLRKVIDVIEKEDNVEQALRDIADARELADHPYPKKKDRQPQNARSGARDWRLPTHTAAPGPAYMSDAYATAVTAKQKRRNTGRQDYQPKPQRYNAADNWRDPQNRAPNGQPKERPHRKMQMPPPSPNQPEGSAANAQQDLLGAIGAGGGSSGSQSVHGQQQTPARNPTYRKPKLFSVPKSSPSPPSGSTAPPNGQHKRNVGSFTASSQHGVRFFVVGVENMRILKTIWKNRTECWPFMTPMEELQRASMAVGGRRMSMHLFFYVKTTAAAYGYSELKFTNGRYSFQTKTTMSATGSRQFFVELPSIHYAGDRELSFGEGQELCNHCQAPTSTPY